MVILNHHNFQEEVSFSNSLFCLTNSWKPKIPTLENLKPFFFFSDSWTVDASYSYKIYICITDIYMTAGVNVSFTEGKWKQTDKYV